MMALFDTDAKLRALHEEDYLRQQSNPKYNQQPWWIKRRCPACPLN